MTTELSWEITPTEQRNRKGKKLMQIFAPILVLTVGILGTVLITPSKDCTQGYFQCIINDFSIIASVAAWIFILIFSILLLAVIKNKIFPYLTRRYVLTNDSLQISKGSRSKLYRWNEFSSFYDYRFTRVEKIDPSSNIQVQALELEKKVKEITGDRYLLRTKALALGFIKKFVVIYAEPDNSAQVKEFLKEHVPEQNLGETTDSGLTFMEFN